MHKINHYTCPNHWKNIAKKQPEKNRNKRRYVYTMNPGKPLKTSMPLIYVIKTLNLRTYKTELRDRIINKTILVNGKPAKDKSAPVGLLDYITLINPEGPTTYQLYFEENLALNLRHYPTLKPCLSQNRIESVSKYFISKGNTLKVQTFQGNLYDIDNSPENISILKNVFVFIEIKEDHSAILKDYSSTPNLLNLIRITGNNKFKTYNIEQVSKHIEKDQEDRICLKLKGKKGNLKKEILSKSELKKRYTFSLISSVEVIER